MNTTVNIFSMYVAFIAMFIVYFSMTRSSEVKLFRHMCKWIELAEEDIDEPNTEFKKYGQHIDELSDSLSLQMQILKVVWFIVMICSWLYGRIWPFIGVGAGLLLCLVFISGLIPEAKKLTHHYQFRFYSTLSITVIRLNDSLDSSRLQLMFLLLLTVIIAAVRVYLT